LRAKLAKQFPEPEVLSAVYNHLGSYFQVAVGQSLEQDFVFDLQAFAAHTKLNMLLVHNAIKLLSQLDLLQVNEGLSLTSRIKLNMGGNELYQFQKSHVLYADILQILLRNYGGIFDYYVSIGEGNLAMQLNISEAELIFKLNKLMELGLSEKYLPVNAPYLKFRKKMEEDKLEAMINYAANDKLCRSRVLLKYFDELDTYDCGVCDICKEKMGKFWTEEKLQQLSEQLRNIDWTKGYTIKELSLLIKTYRDAELATACRILLDKGILQLNSQQQIVWTKKGG
jgi:ATP-dependent DNA helicase RecQ